MGRVRDDEWEGYGVTAGRVRVDGGEGCGVTAGEAKFYLDLRRLCRTFARLKNDIKSGAVRPGLYRNPSDLSYHPSWYHVRVAVADRISLNQKKIIIPHEALTVQV